MKLNTLFIFYSMMLQKINFEPTDLKSQVNIQYIWIWNISPNPLYFKIKPYEFQNRNISLFNGNDTIMFGYFIIGILACSVGTIPEWTDILWECT